LAAEGFATDEIVFEAAVDLRYRQQVHEVTTPLKNPEQLDDDSIEQLVADFETLYQRRFGKGSAYREAGMEMTLFRLSAKGLLERPRLVSEPSGLPDPKDARKNRRRAFIATQGMKSVDVYDFTLLRPGHVIQGPAIINTPITTVVLQARQIGSIDGYRNLTIDLV
jgi:N-methylhydantoinase A